MTYTADVRFFILALCLTACDRLAAAGKLLEDRSNPLVAQGLYLGMDLPEGVDFEDNEDLHTSACEVFLADVTDPSQIEESPVSGAAIRFRSAANGNLSLSEESDSDGKYLVYSGDGLEYAPGEDARVTFTVDGGEGMMHVEAPDAPDIDLDSEHKAMTPMVVDLTDYDYQQIVAAVYDIQRSKLTWDNLPEEVGEIYDFTHTDDPVRRLEIPKDAFQRKGNYVVGVAGMEIAGSDDMDGINTSLSAFIAGRMSIHAVSVTAPDDLPR